MRRTLAIFLCLGLLFCISPVVARAEALSGSCGDNAFWTYDPEQHSLVISGTGPMYDFGDQPWKAYADQVEQVTVNEGITRIGTKSFFDFFVLQQVTLPVGLEGIGDFAFMACGMLTDLVLPEGLTGLSDYALLDSGLKSLTIPVSVKSIDFNLLPRSLTDIYYNGTVAQWQQINFHLTSTEATVHYNETDACGDNLKWSFNESSGTLTITGSGDMYDYDFDMPWYGYRKKIKSIVLPQGITKIGTLAFSECEISDVILPSTVREIGEYAFQECDSLEWMYIPSSMEKMGEYAISWPLRFVFYGGTQAQWETLAESQPGKLSYVKVYYDATLPFFDLYPGKWYYPATEFCYTRQLMVGVSRKYFEPELHCSRGMVVSILYRLAGSPEVAYSPVFSDVPEGKWYTDAAIWAQQKGIASGYENGKFGPDDSVTREQMAVFLKAYTEKQAELDSSARADISGFPDAKQVTWSADAVRWAVSAGILSGKLNLGETRLAPKGNTSRVEMASILMRYMQGVLNED